MKITEAEWKVMNAIWGKEWVSVRDILEMLNLEWEYSTLRTMMNRLAEKGALEARMRANTRLYRAVISKSDARKGEVAALVDRAFEGAFGPFLNFLLEERPPRRARDGATPRTPGVRRGGRR